MLNMSKADILDKFEAYESKATFTGGNKITTGVVAMSDIEVIVDELIGKLKSNDRELKLIAKQQLEIEELNSIMKENKKTINDITGHFYSIGQPLNDNCLMFNNDQKKWCHNVVTLVESLNVIREEED
jgi:hypothetical protein